MIRPNQLVSLTVVFCLLSASFSQLSVTTTDAASTVAVATGADFADFIDEQKGLLFRLSEGAHQPETQPKGNLAPSVQLTEAETASVLKRLPPMNAEIEEAQDFAVREQSLPPPPAGEVMNVTFPAPANISRPEVIEPGPLKVLRYAPEGQVPIASQLSITFSQAMVPLGSQDAAAAYVPVKLTPQPPGKWRWVGTKTLLFEPESRFPMATQYSVTVPSGARSANGSMLAAEKAWKFFTPSPTIKTTYPNNDSPQPRDALMFVGFDQRIDPPTVLRTIRVRAGLREIKTRLATTAEIDANDDVRKFGEAFEDRSIAFRAVDSLTGQTAMALPGGTRITVSIGAGVPSAEGPRVTHKAQTYSFHTHGALRVKKHGCEDGKRCQPSDLFEIEFNNPIDASTFDESKVKVEPPMEDLEVSHYGESLSIDGIKRARTTYRITLDPSTKDTFGQVLGPSPALTFLVGSPPRGLFATDKDFVVLDPFGPASFSVYSMNYHSLRVKLYSVVPEDYPQWVRYQRQTLFESRKLRVDRKTALPGRLVLSKTIAVNSKPDEIFETPIELAAALNEGHGQMILVVQAVDPTGKVETHPLEVWLQRTDLGPANCSSWSGCCDSPAQHFPLGEHHCFYLVS
ncbi:MAG: Ig-like domain-containing protein [Pyrinomonadaceae bacterium]